MASKIFYDCGCMEQSDQFFDCGKHAKVHPGEPPGAAQPATERLIDEIVRQVAELPGRTSPDDWPEAMMVTQAELSQILSVALHPTASAADLDIIRMLPCGSESHPWTCNCYPEPKAVVSLREEPNWNASPMWVRDFYLRWSVSSRAETQNMLEDLLASVPLSPEGQETCGVQLVTGGFCQLSPRHDGFHSPTDSLSPTQAPLKEPWEQLDALVGIFQEHIENVEFFRRLRVAGGGPAVADDESEMPSTNLFKADVECLRKLVSALSPHPRPLRSRSHEIRSQ